MGSALLLLRVVLGEVDRPEVVGETAGTDLPPPSTACSSRRRPTVAARKDHFRRSSLNREVRRSARDEKKTAGRPRSGDHSVGTDFDIGSWAKRSSGRINSPSIRTPRRPEAEVSTRPSCRQDRPSSRDRSHGWLPRSGPGGWPSGRRPHLLHQRAPAHGVAAATTGTSRATSRPRRVRMTRHRLPPASR